MTRTVDFQRREELLESIVDYVFENGLADLSLRPLAQAVGSSPRVLLYHFGGSKDELVQAIIAGVRKRQLDGFAIIRDSTFESPRDACLAVWKVMTKPRMRPLFRFFFELFGMALVEPETYASFLNHAIEDWIVFFSKPLMDAGVPKVEARARATIVLAGFRGFLMDLMATGDRVRIDRAVELWLEKVIYAQ